MNTMKAGNIRVLTDAEVELVSGGGLKEFFGGLGDGVIALGQAIKSIGEAIKKLWA